MYALHVRRSSPDPADPEQFHFPVDDAVTISTDGLTLPTPAAVYLRDERGGMWRTSRVSATKNCRKERTVSNSTRP
ncbi:hypothetical protein [Haladaptatus halobius]|uniref:hypothetical protein n=1 Tax=Haladaptatus halobius TaxID=2884875 RepID=UPI001D0BD06D|nr:hypothetical protein [Haladaptatus halobius]